MQLNHNYYILRITSIHRKHCMVLYDMKKSEELANLINTKHPEWKTLTVRGLKEISGYSHYTSSLALVLVRPEKEVYDMTKTPKQSKNNGKKNPSETLIDKELEKGLADFTTLNSESLEKLLVNALKKQPNNANLIGKAIDFFLKIKGKTDTMEEDFDMEGLLLIGKKASEEGVGMDNI